AAGSGDIVLDNAANVLTGQVTASGHAVTLAAASALDADVQASGDTSLTSAAGVAAQGSFGGALTATGSSVEIGEGSASQSTAIGGKLTAKATGGDVTLGNVQANGASITASGAALLDGTLGSSGNVDITAGAIRGMNSRGALDVTAGHSTLLKATSGSIGKTPGSLDGVVDKVGLITLLDVTGQNSSTLTVEINADQTAWFGVTSKSVIQGLIENTSLNSHTFGCDANECFNVLGQTTAIADSVIANILTSAAQDAADAAFGTDNLDFAIRKGYVTTIGRVPPGIDEIAGDLGATQCDTRVTSPTAIAADKACSSAAVTPRVDVKTQSQTAPEAKPDPKKLSDTGHLIVY
ncbi:MAG TPA: hypothetical protein VF453_21530, partial [Burkholderiaceae bacterium]